MFKVIDMRAAPELAEKFERSWGWNPLEHGKPFGVIGEGLSRPTSAHKTERLAKVAAERKNMPAGMSYGR